MNTKKIVSLTMAGMMLAATQVSAFAATNTATKITSTYKAIDIDVLVPKTGSAYINPYGLPYELDDTVKSTITGQSITTMPLAIVNQTGVKLDVGATVTGTLKSGSDMKLLTAAPTTTDTSKSAYMYLEAALTTLDKEAIQAATDTEPASVKKDSLYPVVAAWTEDSEVEASAPLVVGTTAKTADAPLVTLAAATKNSDGALEVSSGGIAMFRLNGEVVKKPKTDWTTKDGVDVAIAFTFTPNTEEDG